MTLLIKNSGYKTRNAFGSHHHRSKSIRIAQNASACRPEQNVNTREINAIEAHRLLCLFHRQILPKPVAEISKSIGRNDQFQATSMGSS